MPEVSKSKQWIDVWLDNYHNRTDAARDIDALMKKNYKGHKYVPWAIMQRWLYTMDPDAELEVLIDSASNSPVFVFTSTIHSSDEKVSSSKDATTSSAKTDVYVKRHSFFVRVKCTFLGKTFEEVYPIQDSAYNAPNFTDSNLVNKALQRAKAKVISAATGLGFQLYETGDLQFDDDTKTDSDVKVKKTTVISAPSVTKPDVPEVPTGDNPIAEAVHYIKTTPEIALTLAQVNGELYKMYKILLDPKDDESVLADKLKNLPNVKIFLNSLKTRHNANTKK